MLDRKQQDQTEEKIAVETNKTKYKNP